MEIIPAALAAVVVGVVVTTVLGAIPLFSIFAAPMGFVSGLGVGIYMMSKSP